jgi:hypothetical protein
METNDVLGLPQEASPSYQGLSLQLPSGPEQTRIGVFMGISEAKACHIPHC